MQRIGIIGVGTLAEAVVVGLRARHVGRVSFLLSPRSKANAAALAARFPDDVAIAPDNAAVAAGADLVILAVRPSQLAEALRGVTFRAEQVVVSFLAGVALGRVAEAVAPAVRICRVNPLPSIRLERGPNVMFPADPLVEDLFRGLGDLIVADREADLSAIGIASGLISTHYEFQNAIVAWLKSRGLGDEFATLYVRSMFDGLAAVALETVASGEPLDPEHHETKGGLNERGRAYFQEIGWFDATTRALDVIEAHAATLAGAKKSEDSSKA